MAQLPSPQARFAGSPHYSGQGGGRSINLRQFARDGIVLLSHIRGIAEGKVSPAPDLGESLAAADKFEADIIPGIDALISRMRLVAPPDELPQLRDGYDQPLLESLDLAQLSISSIWACG